MTEHEAIINKALDGDVISCELVSNTNNIVYKIIRKNKQIQYVKFYQNNSFHIDNEINLYKIVENKYLKELVYSSENPKFAIFKELKGKSIDELTDEELKENADNIIESVCDFFSSVGKNSLKGYGFLDEKLEGKKESFKDFICERQTETSKILEEYSFLSEAFNKIYDKYNKILVGDNKLIPIDTNLKNIMLTENGTIKFVDPGELISGPIIMAYGDFVAHSYKTILYDKLIEKLKLDEKENKLLRIYAIFSSLNVLAFLKKNGVDNLETVIPYGNKYTFFELIKEHMKYLELK